MIGVKFTTARGVAERAVNLVMKKLGRAAGACRTEAEPLPGGGIADVEAAALESMHRARVPLDQDVVRVLARVYGTRVADVIGTAGERPELAARLAPGLPLVKAEVVHAVREEMAATLADVVLRRTALAHTGDPGPEVARACAEVMALELGWDAARMAREREALRHAFALPRG